MVEFALIAGVLILVLIGIVEIGRLMFMNAELENAASEAVNYVALHKACTSPYPVGTPFLDQVANAAKAKIVIADRNALTVVPGPTPSCQYCPITVVVRDTWSSVLPMLKGGTITKSANKLIEYVPTSCGNP